MSPNTPPTMAFDDTGYRFRAVPIAFVAVLAVIAAVIPLTIPPLAHRTFVILVVAAGLWITEALPVAAVALLIPVLGMAFGVASAKTAFSGFGDPIVFLFFGTFLLTDAAGRHGLNQRLAHFVLGSPGVQAHPTRLLWAVALIGAGASAFVNNTATAALLIPLALTAENLGSRRFLTSLLLMSAYAPSLGGLATPVGTAPNLIGLRLLEEAVGHRPSFASWCWTFAPLSIGFTLLSALWLRWRARVSAGLPPMPAGLIKREKRVWSLAERTLVPVFGLVVLLWITPGILASTPLGHEPWVALWQKRLPEPAVPLLGGLMLFLLPSGDGSRILDAGVFRRIDWSTILLFGGGLSLAAMMFDSGLARALGVKLFHLLPVPGLFGVVLASTLMAVLVSEMTSNTASAALVVPIVIALADVAGLDPVKPALAATLGCSFGFMLPVSTPPNALVFATGRVGMGQMIRNGLLLDVLGVIVVSVWVTLFA